ncbi:tetratricopeptide repeat-containing sulfotransferase family protein [Dyella sp. KULCS107]|uniref:tetratricopeptide repeat-containing sulfotransferase family protein n=1 Tax=Dyella sp. KULCS107 TaxID=3422216 RepID=UPI003D6EA777
MTNPTSANELELRRRARRASDDGQYPMAEALLRDLVHQAPRDVPARMELAQAILRNGRMREATRHLLEAIAFLPNDAPLIAQLAWRLSLQGEILGARQCLDHLMRAPNPPPHVIAEQAHLRWMLGEVSQAARLMEMAAKGGLDAPGEYYLRGMLLQFEGRLDEAQQVLLALLDRWPEHADAAVILANLHRQTASANHLDLLRSLQSRLPPEAAHPRLRFIHAEYHSAQFKVLDDLGQWDEAWAQLERCNHAMHVLNPYDAHAEAVQVAALEAAAAALPALPRNDSPADGPMPIFIVSLPRSGSTLLDHMLSAHSDVVSAGEINDFQRQLHWVADVSPTRADSLSSILAKADSIDFQLLGQRYREQTCWRAQGRRFYIDKMPINLRMVPFIRRALPAAPILHLARAPMDVCYSNLKVMFGNTSAYCYDMGAMAHYYGLYRRLVRRWHALMPGAMLDVDYAALVTQPEQTLARVLAHCGLALEPACLRPEGNPAPVATPSSAQVREPVHTRALEQWRRYEVQLEPLRRALGSNDG